MAYVCIVPGISVQIYIRGANPVAGHRHILDCNVTGAENFDSSSTLTYQWLKNNSSQTRLGINSNSLIFTSLKLSDAGWYTCQVLISSPFLYNVVNATSKAYEVDVEGMCISLICNFNLVYAYIYEYSYDATS